MHVHNANDNLSNNNNVNNRYQTSSNAYEKNDYINSTPLKDIVRTIATTLAAAEEFLPTTTTQPTVFETATTRNYENTNNYDTIKNQPQPSLFNPNSPIISIGKHNLFGFHSIFLSLSLYSFECFFLNFE